MPEVIHMLTFPASADLVPNFGNDLAGQIAGFSSQIMHLLDRLEVSVVTNTSFSYVALEFTMNMNFAQSAVDDGSTCEASVLGRFSADVGWSFPVPPWNQTAQF